jgi:hypothetical protein
VAGTVGAIVVVLTPLSSGRRAVDAGSSISRPGYPLVGAIASAASLHGMMASINAGTSEADDQDPRQARNEDLLTEQPTLGIPRSCHNA